MRYQPGQSTVHTLHPAVKLAWLLWVTVAVFAFDSVLLSVVATGVAVLLLWHTGIAPWRIPAVGAWLVMGLALLITHAVLVREGEPVLGPVTDLGLLSGILAAGRLLAVILMSALFVRTTEPFALACALMRVGLPYRWGFALVTALRLASVFRLEAHHVYQAQWVRGVAYDARGVRRWWLVLRHLSFPLLVSALRTAQSLSLSMEGRAFGLHSRRTCIRELHATARDYVAGTMLVASVLAAVGWGVPVP
ncbi:MAG: energy-coupling factor transporter transmembrane protein EcfT [bacterium]|nr:energy-coupling factor transporter transmembrane protein EcfT [bacterium]